MNWISIKDSEPFELRKILVTDGNEICIHYKPFIHAYQTGDLYVFTATGYIRDSQGKLCKCCDIKDVTHWIDLEDIPKP